MASGGLYLYYLHKQFTVLKNNLPQAGFELGSLGPQAGVLPIEPPLFVNILKVYFLNPSRTVGGYKIKTFVKTLPI